MSLLLLAEGLKLPIIIALKFLDTILEVKANILAPMLKMNSYTHSSVCELI